MMIPPGFGGIRRPMGAKSDPTDARDFGPAQFFSEPAEHKAGFSSSKALDFRTLMDATPHQRGNSCVGHGIATAVYLHAKLHGYPIARPSALAIYAMASMAEHQSIPHRWADEGCQPRLAMRAAQSAGLMPETEWPETTERIGKVLPLQVFRSAIAHKLRSYYRVDTDVVDSLKRLLAAGAPFIFHTPVTAALEQWNDDTVITPDVFSGTKLGRHCQTGIGYDDARGAFLVQGSWGENYGDEGCTWIAYGVIASSITRDRYAITSAPKGLT